MKKTKDILKSIANGNRHFADLDHSEVKFAFYNLEDGIYTDRNTGKKFTAEEFKAMAECDQRTMRIVGIGTEIPLATSEDEVIM